MKFFSNIFGKKTKLMINNEKKPKDERNINTQNNNFPIKINNDTVFYNRI
jgi:hypothetical protein